MGRKLTTALGAAAFAACAIGSLGIAEAKQGGDTKTKVKLALSYFPESQSRNYQAILKSDDDKCLEGRKVTFFEELEGKDEKIATATSNEFGSAFFTDSPAPAFEEGERFYAKVKKSNGCKKGKSKVFEVGPIGRAAGKASATVDFQGVIQSGSEYTYYGMISSEKPKCEGFRKVTVFREDGDKDKAIGSGTSFPDVFTGQPGYFWDVEDFTPPNGTYYAVAKKTKKCKKAVSNEMTFNS